MIPLKLGHYYNYNKSNPEDVCLSVRTHYWAWPPLTEGQRCYAYKHWRSFAFSSAGSTAHCAHTHTLGNEEVYLVHLTTVKLKSKLTCGKLFFLVAVHMRSFETKQLNKIVVPLKMRQFEVGLSQSYPVWSIFKLCDIRKSVSKGVIHSLEMSGLLHERKWDAMRLFKVNRHWCNEVFLHNSIR